MSGTRRPDSYVRHDEVRHGRYWRVKPGFLHRRSGPAIELANGMKEWWLMGDCAAWQGGSAVELGGSHSNTGCRSDIAKFPGYAKGGDEP